MEDKIFAEIPRNVERALVLLKSFEHAELIIKNSGEIVIKQFEEFETEYSLSKEWFGGLQVVAEFRIGDDGIWNITPVPRKWDWID